MDKNTVLYVIAAVLFGFIGGFLLANAMNRSEVAALRAQISQPAAPAAANSAPGSTAAEPALSDAEIKAKLADAEKNASNFDFQKNLGIALYKYASMKQQPDLLPDTIKILERADSLNGKDYDVIVFLGNAYFDRAFQNKDAAGFQKARDVYARALAIKPADTDVQTDTAITWFVQPEPDYPKAVAGLEKVIAADPKHTRAMQFLAQCYVKMNRPADAQKVVDKIKLIDPSDDSIPDLTRQIAAAQAK
jgi:tetratricopeptide (TPR) repeat protein